MAKFKVNAPKISLLNAVSEMVTLEKNEVGNTEDYNPNSILVLSNNGRKGKLKPEDKELSWIYKPSIAIIDGEDPKPNAKIGTKITDKEEKQPTSSNK